VLVVRREVQVDEVKGVARHGRTVLSAAAVIDLESLCVSSDSREIPEKN